MVVWLLGACVVPTTRYYVSPAAASRLTPRMMRDRVSAMMVLQCPSLLASRDSTHGAVGIALAVDSAGHVQRASLRRGSRNAAFDDLLGALAARLALQAPPAANPPAATTLAPAVPPTTVERTLIVYYWCSRSAADVRLQVDST